MRVLILLLLFALYTCDRGASTLQQTESESGPVTELHDLFGSAERSPEGRSLVSEAEGLPLVTAVREGDAEAFQSLLAQGAPVSAADPAGRSALHWAALSGRSDFADALIESGADLKGADAAGRTPLHLAARAGAGPVVRSLLNAGAAPDVRDADGYLPVELASAHGLESEAHALLEAAMTRLQEEPGRNAVRAVVRRYLEALKAGDAPTLQALSVPGTPEPPTDLVEPMELVYTLQQTDLFEEGAVVVGTVELPDWLPVRFMMALERHGGTWRVLGTSLWIE
ncbi:MAG: ankyrin repeat domain-containing protein [Candidatus Aminicenantes bacterium]|nr:ankyrin repeat domain-containing protein [Candidatus Aminicenantes bacterium]